MQLAELLSKSSNGGRRHKGGGGGGGHFLALNFCSLTNYLKLWHNCSLFVKTSFDPKSVTSQLVMSSE